jgi:hypothetical protein
MIKLTKKDAIEILSERDGYHCFICKGEFEVNEYPTLDHWVPRAAGGSDKVANLRLAHRKCNTLKSDTVPLDDGTLPMKKKRVKPADRRRAKKEIQESICYHCNNGRKLSLGDNCGHCGAQAGPLRAPHYLKRKTTDCDHDRYWCWACSIGIVERRSALLNLMIGDSDD